MTDLPIPMTPDDFTPDWLTAALRAGGTAGDGTVTAVEAFTLGEGFGLLGSLARLRLTWDRPPADAPATVIAKFPAQAEQNLALARQYLVYIREARFFNEIKPGITSVPTPRAWYVGYDLETSDGVILLEDLAETHRIGDQVSSPTNAEAMQLMTQIADLHAAWWGRADEEAVDWVPTFEGPVWMMTTETMRSLWPVYQELSGHQLPPGMAEIIERAWDGLPWLGRQLSRAPMTLAHGDYRLDNMFFPPDEGDPVTIIDWQLMSRGRGPYDVAYFMSQSLDVEQRRATERDLLRRYHDGLHAGGVRDYSFDDCFEDYRLATLWCVMYPVAIGAGMAGPTERGAQLNAQTSRRSFAAIQDLDAVSVLPS